MLNNRCETGCRAYTGGEIRHHKDCQFYKDSFSKMYDDLLIEVKQLRKILNNAQSESQTISENEAKEKPYKCNHCGKTFIKKLAHKCNTGFRKKNQSWTIT